MQTTGVTAVSMGKKKSKNKIKQVFLSGILIRVDLHKHLLI